MSKKLIKYFVSLFLLLAVAFIAIKVRGKQQQINQTIEPVSISEAINHDEKPESIVQLEIKEDEKPVEEIQENPVENDKIDEDGSYTDKENVALYIHTYGKLPQNYINKKTAESMGWSSGEAVSSFAPGKSIGGDRFGNYEGLLPKKKGRTYYECDIDAYGKKSRGAKRIVFSNDGLVYYTEDHYESFELLYGE
ncbi:MAG: hypothetical protein J6Y16_11275 [Treponema sp.]|nr:hypothetical protein [Treponema sp.]